MDFKRYVAKNIILPFTFLTAALIAPELIQAQNKFNSSSEYQVKSSLSPDTLWGNGLFLTKNAENNSPVGEVSLYLRSAEIDPNTTYEYTTNGSGFVEFNLPVYINPDGLEEITQDQDKPQILPNFGSELNAFFPKQETGMIEIYNMQGKLVENKEINSDHEYLNLSELNSGMYVYRIIVGDNREFNGKFVKTNSPLQGPASRNNFKSSTSTHGQNRNYQNARSNYQIQSPSSPDTLWGNGVFLTKNAENNSPVGEVSLYLRSDEIDPNTTYEFITDGAGGVAFNLPVYINPDGLGEIAQNETQVLPTFGSELNAFFSKQEHGLIEISNMQGQIVEKKEINSDHEYLNLSELNTGMYIYTIKTSKGPELSGKFMKTDSPLKGRASRPMNNLTPENNFKSTLSGITASYWIKWEMEGFYTDSTLIDIHEGDNGPSAYHLTPLPGPPQSQDIAGIVTDMNNNYEPIQGATIIVDIANTGDSFTTTSSSDGSFVINDIPTNTDITFRGGGISGKYSFVLEYTTPSEITEENLNDTLNNQFNLVLPNKLALSTAQHFRDQAYTGTLQDTVFFYLGSSLNEQAKNWIRNSFVNFRADENDVYMFAESFTPLNYKGINIEYGTYNTNTNETEITTPLGQTLHPVICANSTMGIGYYDVFVHETKRAVGLSEVGWYSVMRADTPAYTPEDKELGEMERRYHTSIYQDGKTWINPNNLVENITDNCPNPNNKKNSVKNELSPKLKDTKENINDYFNNSSNTGDFELNFDYE